MKRWIVLAVGVAGGFNTARSEEKVVHEADRTVVRKKSTVDFSDVAVEGDLTKPEGSYVLDRNRESFQSLIRVRDSFFPELQKSVDNL
jgi:hypothetical protein